MAARYLAGATLTILVSLVGCKTSPTQPDDPLFLDHKPIEAKVERKPPTHVAYVNPVMPTLSPDSGLASKKTPEQKTTGPLAPGMPTNAPEALPREDDIRPLPTPVPER